MKHTTTIRFAQPEDMTDLIILCEQHAKYEKSEYDRTGKKQQLLQHLFAPQPSLHCLVAVQSDKLIGYATYMRQFSTWDASFYLYLDCLFLMEEVRGFGLGEQLMDRIKSEGRKAGCEHVQWQTPDFNVRAIKFYQRIGGISKNKERFFLPC